MACSGPTKDSMMTLARGLLGIFLLALVAQPLPLHAEPRSPRGGSYEITARLELPHLERWGVDKTTIICLPSLRAGDEIPIPVLSANNPFAKCTATNLMADGSKLEYDIVCHEEEPRKATLSISFQQTHSLVVSRW